MKLKTFYVRAAAAAAAALLFLYPFPAHAADSAALQGQVSAAQREYESAASTLDSMQQQASDTRQQVKQPLRPRRWKKSRLRSAPDMTVASSS